MREHGTRTKYVWDHCRCQACVAANNRYARERCRKRSAYRIRSVGGGRAWQVERRATGNRRGRIVEAGIRDRSEAERLCAELNAELDLEHHGPWAAPGQIKAARRHLETLRAHGIGLRRVHALTGITRGTLRDLVTGMRRPTPGRPPRRRPLARTCERILGVRLDVDLPGKTLVPAGETWRLVDELLATGMPKVRIARAIGQVRSSGLQLGRERVTKRNADAVARFHRGVLSIAEGRAGNDPVSESRARVDPCEAMGSARAGVRDQRGVDTRNPRSTASENRNSQPGDSSASRAKPRRGVGANLGGGERGAAA